MWNQYWIPLLMPTLIIKTRADDNNTDTVFVRGGGHADAEYLRVVPTTTTKPRTTTTTTVATTTKTTTTTQKIEETTTSFFEEAKEDVVFVPNMEPPVTRDENEFDVRGLRIRDIMNLKSVHDAMHKNFRVEKEEEDTTGDVVFISGKNHDVEDKKSEEKPRRRNGQSSYYNRGDDQIDKQDEHITEKPILNCNDLDCNNTIQSICGAKLINNEWRYRLFLNDCFFRKVNCGFKYEMNRYMQVENEKCRNIGSHVEKPFFFKPKPHVYKPDFKQLQNDARRSSASRRSMTTNFDGEFCSHPCPVKCPEDYDPQCAMSATGQRRVFLNHCKLDLNSCAFNIVWHKRPLAECVGGKKADMRQNRGFIGWMQRVGIVDRKGRLVLE